MLSSIHPLGERARNNRWAVTVGAFTLAAVTAGAALGAGAGWVGSLLPGGDWRWLVGVAAVAFAAAAELTRAPVPGPRRQVNKDWIGAYRGWVYGAGFGAQLGLGVATYVVTWGVWATWLLAVLVGDPAAGALIGAAFGLGRSVFPVAARWIDRPSRLTAFNQAMVSWGAPASRAVAAGLAAVAVLGVLGGPA